MKRRRRIEVLIERRELSVFGIPPAGGGAKPCNEGGASIRGAPEKHEERPSRCSTCGSTEMLRLSEALALMALDPVAARSSAERSDVHCTFSISAECWVCKPSLHLS
ncbi:hypothetical protein [Occallatibacter riparius]|uniref:Uncharacterized protein n=1 Tax=Occallatibacter riparius TaxID=1002689 RepID=A0A9J7BJH0_9BACT|nr:hypothetical protein [Occallatibacter riparius]UWZ81938.1 hypothetical protein MOP44_15285 [Occallatibacter riparius]